MHTHETIDWKSPDLPSIRMNFTPTVLEAETPTDIKECFIEIFPDHIRYFVDFISEKLVDPEDPMLGANSVRNYFDTIVRRDFIQTVEFSEGSANGETQWVVFFDTASANFKTYFYKDDFEKAKDMFDQIRDWYLYNRVTDVNFIKKGFEFDEMGQFQKDQTKRNPLPGMSAAERDSILGRYRNIGTQSGDNETGR